MKLITMIALTIVFQIVSTSNAQTDPLHTIMTKDVELKTAIHTINADTGNADRDKLMRIASGIFDFRLFGRSVVPRGVWDTCSQSMRDTFTIVFKELMERSSVGKLELYKSDSTTYDSAVIDGGTAKVISHLWNQGRENILIYKMVNVNGEWKVVDLIINDLSTARSYREQFTTLFKIKGMNDIIELLRKKTSSESVSPAK